MKYSYTLALLRKLFESHKILGFAQLVQGRKKRCIHKNEINHHLQFCRYWPQTSGLIDVYCWYNNKGPHQSTMAESTKFSSMRIKDWIFLYEISKNIAFNLGMTCILKKFLTKSWLQKFLMTHFWLEKSLLIKRFPANMALARTTRLLISEENYR